jgi:dTDP-4-dehydrorhamnose 3,5-epimerase
MNDITPNGLIVVAPVVFADARGYFYETYNEKKFEEIGITDRFVQDNQSCSLKGVMRGLHFQKGDSAQSKLVRVVKGSVVDFVLDIREDSETFGQMYYVYLSDDNKKQLYIPRGFAHGFISLEDGTIFQYKCGNFYDKSAEGGYNIFSQKLNIQDELLKFMMYNDVMNANELIDNAIISDKDRTLPNF